MINVNTENTIYSFDNNMNIETKDFVLSLEGRISSGSSTNRIKIWQTYSSEIKLFGNSPDVCDQLFFDKIGRYEQTHNAVLDIYFWFGIIVGSFYLLFYIRVFIIEIRKIFNLKNVQTNRYWHVALLQHICLFRCLIMLLHHICAL